MIYTVTFNPSLDYLMRVKDFQTNMVNRAEEEFIYPGGKGINVSIVLSNLKVENTALGFIAGFIGDEIENMAVKRGCRTEFIKLDAGFSRVNIKLKSNGETEINGKGPDIPDVYIQKLLGRLEQLEAGDFLVLAGSIPASLPDDIYENIMERLQNRGIHFVVDATKDLLLNVLKYHPFLIKPNNHELSEMLGRELNKTDEIIEGAKELQKQGAGNVLISMAGEGAILCTESGKVYQSPAPKGRVVNSVGAGDSMVAGFLTGYIRTGNMENAFKMGLAAGSASAFSEVLATEEEVMALWEKL